MSYPDLRMGFTHPLNLAVASALGQVKFFTSSFPIASIDANYT